MQEEQVTIGDQTFPIEAPFLVLATQNPIEQEGTYPLPEAQIDRFMMKLVVDYPKYSEEREMIGRFTVGAVAEVQPVVDSEYILNARDIVRKVHVDEKIQDYVLNIVVATRNPGVAGLGDLGNLISYGASPRAGPLSSSPRLGRMRSSKVAATSPPTTSSRLLRTSSDTG